MNDEPYGYLRGDVDITPDVQKEIDERLKLLDDGELDLSSGRLVRWADRAMWEAPHDKLADLGEPVEPQVTLISMTPNPLRAMEAANRLYRGGIVHSPGYVTRLEALRGLEECTKTALQAPLEFIDFHFLFEGVTRAFTHQLVRQRTAVYVQESLRFAVKTNGEHEVAIPPSIARLKEDHPSRVIWNQTVKNTTHAYNALVNAGIPAEDARGLLPTNITTRVHYKTNLRNLAEHAGLRLCTQAQYEWKQVWKGIAGAILSYGPDSERWQQQAIVGLFKPICYRTGKCEFMSDTDRACTIRDRVQAHHSKGEPSTVWLDIDPMEPLREGAARIAP